MKYLREVGENLMFYFLLIFSVLVATLNYNLHNFSHFVPAIFLVMVYSSLSYVLYLHVDLN